MRKCFVPGCNVKNQQPRPMFLAPKDKRQFQKWQEVLQYNRPLKPNDLVCYLHFRENEIKRFFNHIIKGELFQLERDRARLSEDAVPSQNLPNKIELKQVLPTKKAVYIKTKKRTKTALKSISLERVEMAKAEEKKREISKEHEDNLIAEAFNNLYRNVLQVKMPNTLWGVQRGPQSSMIYFSYISSEKLRHTKLLTIDCHGSFNTFFNGSLYSKIIETYMNLTPEYVTKCLALLDKTQK